jgi:hypothetical protein
MILGTAWAVVAFVATTSLYIQWLRRGPYYLDMVGVTGSIPVAKFPAKNLLFLSS